MTRYHRAFVTLAVAVATVGGTTTAAFAEVHTSDGVMSTQDNHVPIGGSDAAPRDSGTASE